ncbi:DUF935 family protein [Tannerella forsythia]|uniref:phage portal protein family protein n=1 Tax=Tannerella forsythia TaxID=28112 RepID=UPI0028E741D4|nr:DUF935 family protein [Tannerella forsythia]
MADNKLQRQNKPASAAGVRNGRRPKLRDTRGTDKIEIDYFRFYESLYRKEVTDYQSARAARYDPFNPLTFPLQQLYKDAILDNHAQGAIENRILRVTNKECVIKSPEGDIDRVRSRFVQKKWFRHLIRKAMESKFYGYSMLFVNSFEHGNIREIIDIPRENVIPERGMLLKNAMHPTGEHILFREFPNFLIYIQLMPDAIGILERIAPLTIYKRHSWASWDEFEQFYGVPIRIARTMINTKKHKDELQKWLEMMGSGAYGIFDKQTDIEIKENSKTDAYNVFLQKINIINKEISKGTNGQTMTMDDGSSQSQANVHLLIYDEITKADIMDVQDWASDQFFPIMRSFGYDIPDGYYLELQEPVSIKPEDKIKIDEALMRGGFKPKRQYIEEFYGTPLEEEKEEPKPEPEPEKGSGDEEPAKNDEEEELSFFV